MRTFILILYYQCCCNGRELELMVYEQDLCSGDQLVLDLNHLFLMTRSRSVFEQGLTGNY